MKYYPQISSWWIFFFYLCSDDVVDIWQWFHCCEFKGTVLMSSHLHFFGLFIILASSFSMTSSSTKWTSLVSLDVCCGNLENASLLSFTASSCVCRNIDESAMQQIQWVREPSHVPGSPWIKAAPGATWSGCWASEVISSMSCGPLGLVFYLKAR